MKLNTLIKITIIMCLITIFSCDSEGTKYNFIINHPDIRVKENLMKDLVAKKITFKKGDDGIILIKQTDSAIVIRMLSEIQSQFRKKIYSVEFDNLNDAKLYTKKLHLKAIPNTMKDGCCPQYYRIEVPIEYSGKAMLASQEFLKNYKTKIDPE